MADEQPSPEAQAPAPKPRIGTFTRALWAVIAILGISNLVLSSAVGSYAGQNLDDPQLAAGLVAAGAAVAVFVVPLVGAIALLRQLQARGIKIKFARTLAALVVLWNVVLFLGLTAAAPVSTSELLMQRGTWIVDAARGVGPFGPAATPVVQRRLAELSEVQTLTDAVPYLSNETASGFGAHWVVMLDGTRRGAKDESKVDVLIGKHGIDIEALRDDPTALPQDLDGRALLADVGALMTDASGPTWLAGDMVPVEAEPTPVDRVTLDLGDGKQARYEDGDWRIHLADVATLTAGTAQQLATAKQVMTGLERPAPSGDPSVVSPHDGPDLFEEPRAVLETALRGQAGLLTGTTAFFAEWPDALTRTTGVAQAEALRRSCAKAAGSDAVFAAEHTALRDRYGLSEGSAPDPAVLAQLDARGRRYLTDVLTLCAPVFRLSSAGHPGGVATDAQKARWARLDAAEQASSATFAEAGDDLKATVGSETITLVEEDGAWRVAQ